MSLLPFLLALAKSKTPQTISFPIGSRSFTVPAGVNRLETMVGRGGPSRVTSAGRSGYSTRYRKTTTRNGQATVENGELGKTYGATAPSDYCTLDSGWDGTAYYDIETCYYFTPFTEETSVVDGNPLVAFGRTFPGRPASAGTVGPAASVTYTSVPVSPGQTYNFVVPDGDSIAGNEGKLTITFYS